MSNSSYNILSNLRTITFDNVIIYENIWLGNTCNLVAGRYNYTFNDKENSRPNDNTKLTLVAKRYKMSKFIYDSIIIQDKLDIKYSKGSIWLGEGNINSGGIGIDNKIDIQTMMRCICRQEIEYALWNFIVKLKENNIFDGNPSDLRLKWFFNIEYPSNNITTNGFALGTDNTEFPNLPDIQDIQDKQDILIDNDNLLINNQN